MRGKRLIIPTGIIVKRSPTFNQRFLIIVFYKIGAFDTKEYNTYKQELIAAKKSFLPMTADIQKIEVYDAVNNRIGKKLGDLKAN